MSLSMTSTHATGSTRRQTAPQGGILHAIRVYLERRRTAAELSRLSDRELSDIGITRDGIYAAAHGVSFNG